MLDVLTEAPCPVLPNPVHAAKAAIWSWQKLRREHLKDLDFELVKEWLPPGFFQADLTFEA